MFNALVYFTLPALHLIGLIARVETYKVYFLIEPREFKNLVLGDWVGCCAEDRSR